MTRMSRGNFKFVAGQITHAKTHFSYKACMVKKKFGVNYFFLLTKLKKFLLSWRKRDFFLNFSLIYIN